MKMKFYNPAIKMIGMILVVLAVGLAGVGRPAQADTYNWNGSTTGGGTGVNNTWDTATANWTGFGTTWPAAGTDNDAVFGGTAGTVTISGGVTANDLTFNTTGYTVTASTLTLNGTTPTITLNNVAATINSSLTLSSDANITLAGVTAQRFLNLGGGLSGTNRNLAVSVTGTGGAGYSGIAINAAGSYSGTLSVTNNAASGQAQLAINQAAAQNALIDTDVTANSVYFQLGNGVSGNLVQVRSLAGNNTSNNVSSDNRSNTLVIGTNNNSLTTTTYSGNVTNGGGGGAQLSLIKSGTATQVLAGTNNYTGSTKINGGILRLSSLSSSSALSFTNNAALEISAAMTLGNNVTIASGQSGTIKTTGAHNVTLSGNYSAMAGTLTLDMTSNTGTGYRGFVAGSANGPTGTVNVNGSDSVETQINLSNSLYQDFFANATVVANAPAKRLYFAGANTATGMQFGALDGGNNNVDIGFDNSGTNRTVTINGTANGNFAGRIYNGGGSAGPASLVKNGGGTQILSGPNAYTGTTTVNGGALQIGSAANLPSGSAVTFTNNAALNISGAMTLANNVTIASGQSGTIKTTGPYNVTLSGNYSAMAGTLTLDMTSATVTPWQGFVAGNAAGPTGVVNVKGSNSIQTQINLSNPSFQNFFANAKVIANSPAQTLYFAGAHTATGMQFGALDGGNSNVLIGFDNASGRTVTINGTTSGNFAGTIFNGYSAGANSLVKTGGGTQILSGSNTYTGTTAVNGGTLLVNGTHTGGGMYTVGDGTGVDTLGGTGSLSAAVTLMSGGKLSPGASIESLATGANTWNGGGLFDFEFSTDGSGTAGTDWDLLAINGLLDMTGASSGSPVTVNLFTMADATTPGLLSSWDPNISHVWAGFVTSSGLTSVDSTKFAINAAGFQNAINGTFSVVTNGNNLDLVYTAVPEPTTFAMLLLGSLMLWAVRRKRK